MANIEKDPKSVKFYTWMDRRWCGVDAVTGAIESKRHKARFVCFRNGRLNALRRWSVLRGLRALAAGRPSVVRDGPPLPHRRVESIQQKKLAEKEGQAADKRPREGCRHCCSRQHGRPARQEADTQTEDRLLINNNVEEVGSKSPTGAEARAGSSAPARVPNEAKTPTKNVRGVKAAKRPPPQSATEEDDEDDEPTAKGRPAPTGQSSSEGEGGGPAGRRRPSTPGQYRELIIEEDDVDVLREFLISTNEGFDRHRFDNDDEYKLSIFYQINPLVYMEKCERLERMLREPSKDYFASRLGLRSVSEVSSEARRSRRLRALDESRGSGRAPAAAAPPARDRRPASRSRSRPRPAPKPSAARDAAQAPPKPKKPARVPPDSGSCGVQYREYTPAEDQAIVAWVSGGGRARLVNGNRLWRELQAQYPRVAGRTRTWQSLRNRYLRNILPALAAMPLPPAHASRLRAAAATGELKEKRAPRRNSLHDRGREQEVRGASAKGPRPPPPTPTPPPTPPPPSSSSSSSPSSAHSSDSEATSSSSAAPPPKRLRSSAAGGATRAPSYAQVLRRFEARRGRGAPASAPSAARPRPRPRPRPGGGGLRRLFNPDALA